MSEPYNMNHMRFVLTILLLLLTCELIVAQVVPVTLYYTNDWVITMPGNHSIVRECAIDTVDKVFSGAFTDAYENGAKLAEGIYENGVLHGPFTAFHSNGVPFAYGEYRDNRKFGIWRYYFANGKPMEVVDFDSVGLFVIQMAFNEEGRQVVNKGTGRWVRIMETDSKPDYVLKTEFKNGKRVGRWVFKSKYGHSYHVERYVNGELKNTNDRYVRKSKDSLFSTIDHNLFEFDQLKKTDEFAVTMYAARHYPAIEPVLKKATNVGSASSYVYPDSMLITLDLHAHVNRRLRRMNDTLYQDYEGLIEVRVTESMTLEPRALSLPGSIPLIDARVAGAIRTAPPLVRSPYNFRPGQKFYIYYKHKGRKSPYALIFFSREELDAHLDVPEG